MAATTSRSNAVVALCSGHARYVPRTPWHPVTALIVTSAACLTGIFVYAVVLELGSLLAGPGGNWETLSGEMMSLASPFGLAVIALSQVLALAIIWTAAGRGGMRRDVLQFADPKPGWIVCAAAGLALVAAVGMLEFALFILAGFDPFGDSRWIGDGLSSPYWWGTVLVVVVLAPLWEEAAFRGFLLSALAQSRLGYWPAAVISTGLWTALHWGYSYAGLATVFAAGLGLCSIMWRLGSLRAVVVAHAIANVAALLFAYFFIPPDSAAGL